MKTFFSWLFVCAFVVSGCSPEPSAQPRQDGPQESFQQIVTELKARSAKKSTDILTITVTDQIVDDIPNEPVSGTIQVKKQSSVTVPDNANQTAEIIVVYFLFESGNWRCLRATSKELKGDKIVAQNSLDGPDIRLANLMIWIGL